MTEIAAFIGMAPAGVVSLIEVALAVGLTLVLHSLAYRLFRRLVASRTLFWRSQW